MTKAPAVPLLSERHRLLIRALADGRTASGNALAHALGISRTAVWNGIRFLQAIGLSIDAVPGAGYRLQQPLELLDAAAIRQLLTPGAAQWLGHFELHDIVGSTNSALRAQARQGVASGSVCLAEMQTAGRGRMGRTWLSPFAGNIYLSVLWHFPSPAALEGLSLAVGALIVRVLRQAGAAGVEVKWPNDLLWQERKLGGVLIELSGEINGQCAAIIGIGINCFLPRTLLGQIDQPAVDLAHIPGLAGVSRNRLVAGLLNETLPALAEFAVSGFDAYREEWRRYHAHEGRNVRLEVGPGNAIHGRVAGVDQAGALLLEDSDGLLRAFTSGDVSLRLEDT